MPAIESRGLNDDSAGVQDMVSQVPGVIDRTAKVCSAAHRGLIGSANWPGLQQQVSLLRSPRTGA